MYVVLSERTQTAKSWLLLSIPVLIASTISFLKKTVKSYQRGIGEQQISIAPRYVEYF